MFHQKTKGGTGPNSDTLWPILYITTRLTADTYSQPCFSSAPLALTITFLPFSLIHSLTYAPLSLRRSTAKTSKRSTHVCLFITTRNLALLEKTLQAASQETAETAGSEILFQGAEDKMTLTVRTDQSVVSSELTAPLVLDYATRYLNRRMRKTHDSREQLIIGMKK